MHETPVQSEWVCTKCQGRNLSAAQTCVVCGERNPRQQVTAPVPADRHTMRCVYCRIKITNPDQFPTELAICLNCGAPLYPERFQGAIACPGCGKLNQYSPTVITPRVATCGACAKPLFPKLFSRFSLLDRNTRAVLIGCGVMLAISLVIGILVAGDEILKVGKEQLIGYRWLVEVVILVFLLGSIQSLLKKNAIEGIYHAAVALVVGICSFGWAFPKMDSIKSGLFQLGMGAETLMGGHSLEDAVRLVQFHYYTGLILIIGSTLMITAGLIINALPRANQSA